ncbi:MAG: hypothetical protein K2Q18_04685 [Bdellovibrionales bacterium]|nr:hypothetical protein [Bdellovibrionales bacterium]
MKRYFLTSVLSFLLCYNSFAQTQEIQPKKELTLLDLRIPEEKYTSQMQDVRERKLNGHRHLGALTLGLTAATIVTAILAKNKVNDDRAARGGRMDKSDADNFNLHMLTAGVTLASYFTTAYYSISAPKSDSMSDADSVKWHKRFAYVHMPAMIIGPILGLKAIDDYKKGRNPSGAAKLHRPIMILGAAALAGAAIAVEF